MAAEARAAGGRAEGAAGLDERRHGAVGGGQALDGGDFTAIGLGSQHIAGLDRLPVFEDGAGAALGGVAADVGAGQVQMLTQYLHEEGMGGDVYGERALIYLQMNLHFESPMNIFVSESLSIMSVRWRLGASENPCEFAFRRPRVRWSGLQAALRPAPEWCAQRFEHYLRRKSAEIPLQCELHDQTGGLLPPVFFGLLFFEPG